MTLKSYISNSVNIVNKRINKYFSKKPFIHPLLKKSILYSINSGGKRIRPVLMFLTYELFGGKKNEIIDAACALEMIHTYSLIHDDLPAMDDDDLRRGKPTNHKVFGEALAILAGDGLLTDAFHILSTGCSKIKPDLKLKAIEVLSLRAGSSGMVSGQVADLISEGTVKKVNSEKKLKKNLSYIHQHKTSDLIMASAEIGCILSGKLKYLNKISEFAKYMGLSFQITDDILDVIGNKKKLGKKGSDIENEKLTYVSLYGIEKSKKMAERYYTKAIKVLDSINIKNNYYLLLKELARLIVRRDR